MSKFRRLLTWLRKNYESILALVGAAVTAYLGAVGTITGDQMSASVLGVLTLLAFGQMRSAAQRDKVLENVNILLLQHASPPSLDTVFHAETDERPIIASAKEEIWVIQETGNLLAEKAKIEILSFLGRGGKIRAVFTSPTDATSRFLGLRNANLAHSAILNRSNLANAHFENLLKDAGDHAENVTIRFMPYPIGWTMVIADPDSQNAKDRNALVRSAGFKIPYASKIDLSISGAESPNMFLHFAEDAKRHYLYSSKCILLKGDPESGKTTLFKRLIMGVKDKSHVFYVYCPEQVKNGKRIGFEYISSLSETPVTFASRNSNGHYNKVAGAWDSVVAGLKQAELEGKVIIFDEIGPLQLSDPALKSIIMRLINEPSVTLIASIAHPSTGARASADDIRAIFRNLRSEVYTLGNGHGNSGEIFNKLHEELEAAIVLNTTIPIAMRH